MATKKKTQIKNSKPIQQAVVETATEQVGQAVTPPIVVDQIVDHADSQAAAKIVADKAKADKEAKVQADAEAKANRVPAMRTRTAKGQPRYFRGGQQHSKEWTEFAAETFTVEQAEKVMNDPHLRVELLD